MGEFYSVDELRHSTDELIHWGIPGKHKYIAKIGEGIKARYFYTQEQIDAYKNAMSGKTQANTRSAPTSANITSSKTKPTSQTNHNPNPSVVNKPRRAKNVNTTTVGVVKKRGSGLQAPHTVSAAPTVTDNAPKGTKFQQKVASLKQSIKTYKRKREFNKYLNSPEFREKLDNAKAVTDASATIHKNQYSGRKLSMEEQRKAAREYANISQMNTVLNKLNDQTKVGKRAKKRLMREVEAARRTPNKIWGKDITQLTGPNGPSKSRNLKSDIKSAAKEYKQAFSAADEKEAAKKVYSKTYSQDSSSKSGSYRKMKADLALRNNMHTLDSRNVRNKEYTDTSYIENGKVRTETAAEKRNAEQRELARIHEQLSGVNAQFDKYENAKKLSTRINNVKKVYKKRHHK